MLATRLIANDPQEILDTRILVESEGQFEWRFDGTEEEAWRITGGLEGRHDREDCLTLEAVEGQGRLSREVQVEASLIQAVEVEIDGVQSGHVRLFWAREGEPFAPDRVLTLDASTGREGRFLFDLAAAARHRWSGTIRALAIDPGARPGVPVCLRSVKGIRLQNNVARLAEVVSRPWKVELGNDTRSGLFAPPGLPYDYKIDLAPGSELHFAYGVDRPGLAPVRFSIVATTDGGKSAEVFADEIVPGDADSFSGWREGMVALEELTGAIIELSFRTSVPEMGEASSHPLDSAGLPFWGNPEIWRPRQSEDLPPNIVLVVIDTLRADRMSLYGYPRSTTPRLEEWAHSSGVVFLNAVAQAPWTLPSHASLFTGQNAQRHGVNFNAVPSSLDLLAEKLRREGYTTYATTAGGYLDPKFGLAQGFDVYKLRQDSPKMKEDFADELVRGIDEARAWLEEASWRRPFFFFFHTYETHAPFWPRAPFYEELGGDPTEIGSGFVSTANLASTADNAFRLKREFFMNINGHTARKTRLSEPETEMVARLYDSGIAYTDHHLGRLLDRLTELGLDQNTVVIITSDHGEALGEHDLIGHGYLHEDNLLVPLVVAFPGGNGGGKRVEDQVRSVDVVPTVLELAGIASPHSMDGASLLPLIRGVDNSVPTEAWTYAASTNWGLSLRIANRIKYIYSNTVWPPEAGRERVFLLQEDPAELNDVSLSYAQVPELRERMVREVEDTFSGLLVHLSNRSAAQISGVITGSIVRASGISSPDLPCNCIGWLGGNQMSFETRPGQDHRIYFENVFQGGLLEIQGEVGNRIPFNLTVDTDDDVPSGIRFEEGEWIEAVGDRDLSVGEASITVSLIGSRPAKPVDIELDDELVDQLRALGYVE